MSKKNHYVDNKAFYEALKVYIPLLLPLKKEFLQTCTELKKKGVKKKDFPYPPRPQTPEYDYIGECFLKIANHLAFNHMFVNYSYREEMIGDALENAIRYMDCFDPIKYDNPFAYFTQMMKQAFWRRRQKEENQAYVKQKMIESDTDYFTTQNGDKGRYKNSVVEYARENGNDIVTNFEEKKRIKKAKAKLKDRLKKDVPTIDQFFVEV